MDATRRDEALSGVSGVKVKSGKIRIQRKKNGRSADTSDDPNVNRYHSGNNIISSNLVLFFNSRFKL